MKRSDAVNQERVSISCIPGAKTWNVCGRQLNYFLKLLSYVFVAAVVYL
jgi:hypothetical protein